MNKKFNRLASMLLAVSMVFSAVPAFATSTETGKDIVVDENNQGGKGSVPVTLNVGTAGAEGNAILQFSVTVPTSLPVHVDKAGEVTVAKNAEIVNRSSGPVEVKSIGIASQNDWLLADWNDNLATEKVGTKKYALAIQGPKTTTNTAVTRNSDTAGTGDTSTFEQIAGKGDTANSSKPFTYNAHIAPQATAVSATIANVVFTIGWDEANVKGVDATVDKGNVTTPPQEENEPEPIIYNDDGSITAKVGSVIPLGGFAYYSDEMPAIGWKSSNEDLATVDNDGNVTILDGSSGYEGANDDAYKVTITCYFKDAYGNEDSTTESNNIVFHVWNSKPKIVPYLTFEEENGNDFKLYIQYKYWDGTLEYSTDGNKWAEFVTSNYMDSVNGKLYLRGNNNTTFNSNNNYSTIKLIGTNVKCIGNIETLLDWQTVANGNHPTMAVGCFTNLFANCTSLIQAPELPAITLTSNCYESMFANCKSLRQAPELPAKELSDGCYNYMFYNCTSLKQAPELPATKLSDNCYKQMFYNCTSLEQAPELPATELANNCYNNMFEDCASLKQAPALPATELSDGCYAGMFVRCTSLSQAPALPATNLANSCYSGMFNGCKELTQIPVLPATELVNSCYNQMFFGCTKIKLSTTKTGEYQTLYRIPMEGNGTNNTSGLYSALDYMFTGTGGDFKGTPTINTPYYLSNTNSVV